MKKFFKYFFQGLIFIAPLGLTLYIIYALFNFLDGIIQQYIHLWFKVHIPGLGVVAIFILISFVGFLGQSIIFRPVRRLLGKLIDRTPVLKVIYSSIRDLLNAFVGKEKKFNQPVLVKVNTISELEKVGFLTQSDLSDLGIKDKVAVYFPHSYNFSGELFIVPAEHVKPFDMSPADAMKFVVSGGIARG